MISGNINQLYIPKKKKKRHIEKENKAYTLYYNEPNIYIFIQYTITNINMSEKPDINKINDLLINKSIIFPSNKIKKIIQQSDEEIGKQTSITPAVVSHAMMLFMAKLVVESCETLLEDNQGNKLDLNILEKSIKKDDEFDFLIDE